MRARLEDNPLSLESVPALDLPSSEILTRENDMRMALKGLLQIAEVVNLKLFYYPLYHLELSYVGKKKVVWIDGRSGKHINV